MKFVPAVFALILLALPDLSGAATAPPGGVLKFDVLRDGKQIGTHILSFSDGGRSVDIQTDIAVKLLFVTVYRFELTSHEEWDNGQLVALKSKSNDDGTRHTLSAKTSESGLTVTVDGAPSQAKFAIVPASLWREETIRQDVLLNSLDGRKMKVTITDKGEDAIDAAGAAIMAHHYVIDGDLAREIWYDGDGMLVHIRLVADDGSTVDYQLR